MGKDIEAIEAKGRSFCFPHMITKNRARVFQIAPLAPRLFLQRLIPFGPAACMLKHALQSRLMVWRKEKGSRRTVPLLPLLPYFFILSSNSCFLAANSSSVRTPAFFRSASFLICWAVS